MSDRKRRLFGRRKKSRGASDGVTGAADESAATSERATGMMPASGPERRSLFVRRRRAADAPVVGAGLMRPFNLAPQPEVVEKTPTIGVGKLVLTGVVVAGVLALGALYLSASSGRDAAAEERDSVQEILDRPAPVPGGGPDAAEQVLFADQLFRETAIAGVLTERVAWDRILRSIARVSPGETWFSTMVGSPAQVTEALPDAAAPADASAALPGVTVNGFADDHETLAVFIGRLSALRELENVALDSSGGTLIGETEVVQFSISASVTPGRTS